MEFTRMGNSGFCSVPIFSKGTFDYQRAQLYSIQRNRSRQTSIFLNKTNHLSANSKKIKEKMLLFAEENCLRREVRRKFKCFFFFMENALRKGALNPSVC